MFKTNYSFRKAIGTPSEIIPILKSMGYKYAPIADIESTFGFSEWTRECEKHDIKPIYGVQIAVTESINAKKPAYDHFTFYAKDNIKVLNDLVAMAFKQGRKLPRFGFTPMLRYSDLSNDLCQQLIIVSGRKSNLDLIPDNVHVGIAPSLTKIGLKKIENKPVFMAMDNFFTTKDDSQLYEVMCGMNADIKTFPQHILSHDEWLQHVVDKHGQNDLWQQAVDNSNKLFSECTATLVKGDLLRIDSNKTLLQLCEEGAKIKGIDLNDSVYAERLKTELKVINDKQFEDYFFIVHDLIDWCKKHMLVGPGRGSSVGSLVCYLLDIVDVDPVKYDLLFFRFLDPNRADWPDIDSDVSDRDLAIDYLTKKHGADRVAKIGTLGNFKVKSAVNEVCKSLLLPRFEFEPLLKEVENLSLTANDKRWDTVLSEMIETTSVGKKLAEKYPEFLIANKVTSKPSHSATHASGVIVSNEPITNTYAINPETQTIMAVANDVESKGYIKLDVLGLINLNVIQKTMNMVGLTRDDMRKIGLEDQKVFDVMNEHRYQNIFQYEGAGVSKLARQVKVDSFNDFVAISSFARPGPLSSGSAERWVKKKNGDIPVSYMHPLLQPYFEDTLGEMCYQEQIMNVAHDIAGLDWPTVSKLRKAISKSMGADAMRELGDPFKQGMIDKGIGEDIANKFWNDILGCGAYLFNKSHALSYGLISYWTCYLKAYYPLEMACSALTSAESIDKQISILRELQKEGTDYIPFDIEHSTDSWRVVEKNDEKFLLAPLTAVKGVGPKTMAQILSCRARNEPLPESIQKRLDKAKSIFSSLSPVNDWLEENGFKPHLIRQCEDALPNGDWQEGVFVAGVCDVIAERCENEPRRVEDRIARGQQGYKSGQTKFVELRVRDDTGTIYVKIGAREFDQLGTWILKDGKEKKTIIGAKVTITPEAPVCLVKELKILGELD